ncbi:hypothetical protein BWQ96_09163 [Gracilariopsis chorda]|uniref:Uncharacterized protein n=1 Tax=Gracilariopsis chorda TaxID=448386 RepID=A0A2V3IGC8_9FLOR|nr:hypothetical protein BWQ96_09163 [Gracilariopsis chorda]|eukprot:PXF41131.1 hypothetical protein BWQ96_09163 [Gracilariopsis chorda]
MQCPSCYGNRLSPTGDGALVCDDCGEQIAGFQEEEVDFALSGTAVTNRASQSSQARATRKSLEARHFNTENVLCKKPTDEILLCEGVFILAKAIATALIRLRYSSDRIMVPLFEVITCWVRRRHAGAHRYGTSHKGFQQYHVLSLICLASLYIRAPMLPRDLCRLVATRQVPYFAVLGTVFPAEFHKTAAIRKAFTPTKFPVAKHVIRVANELASDKHAWPPLRKFFQTNSPIWCESTVMNLWGSKRTLIPTWFPVAHLHISILRLSRLLGLPDDFGARVLRFMELRLIAVKMARVLNGEQGGPWDDSRLDSYHVNHIPNYLYLTRPFSKVIRAERDLYGFPTDQSLQVDFINTMRICYCRRKLRPNVKKEELSNKEETFRQEWEQCKTAMLRWLNVGSVEDIDNVGWTALSPEVISTMKGRQIRAFAKLVDEIHLEKGEDEPELWGRLVNAFKEIGESGSDDEMAFEMSEQYGAVVERECMYDLNRIEDGMNARVEREVADMIEERELLDSLDLRTEQGEPVERGPIRQWDKYHPANQRSIRNRKGLYRKLVSKYDYVWEPQGMGLAWTIMFRFFSGSNVVLEGMKATQNEDVYVDQMRKACDRTLGVVIRYILGLKGGGGEMKGEVKRECAGEKTVGSD